MQNVELSGAAEESGSTSRQIGNVILIGIMGSGKTAVGWHLARLLGFGFVDLDEWIETRSGQTIANIFESKGEEGFRLAETEAVVQMLKVKNHVIAVGGGAVVDDENWHRLKALGKVVWLNTSPGEIARRLVMRPEEIQKRPFLKEALYAESKEQRFQILQDKVNEYLQHRLNRYQEADYTVVDAYSTPEASAMIVKQHITGTRSVGN